MGHNPKARLGIPLHEAAAFTGRIAHGPALPAINYGRVGKQAPGLLSTPTQTLPKAETVVLTWADAEWAALQHVFCSGDAAMPYSARTRGSWTGWETDTKDLPSHAPADWSYWGYYRLVEVGGNPVLLFKSNTHLDWPGASYLIALIEHLVVEASPKLILSVGTAGGAGAGDHIGTVRAVSAGTLYEAHVVQSAWPEYKNGWTPGGATLGNAHFRQLLYPVPTKANDLEALCAQFNQHYGTQYTLAELDPHGLNMADATPQIDNQTGGGASLLTTSSFVVGTTSGNYQSFTAIEMDDAVIGEACAKGGTAFGFVRNISDPVQNAALPANVQGHWGSTIYDAYGFYTSFNSALTTWAMLA